MISVVFNGGPHAGDIQEFDKEFTSRRLSFAVRPSQKVAPLTVRQYEKGGPGTYTDDYQVVGTPVDGMVWALYLGRFRE